MRILNLRVAVLGPLIKRKPIEVNEPTIFFILESVITKANSSYCISFYIF